jgi:hypothetical protein
MTRKQGEDPPMKRLFVPPTSTPVGAKLPAPSAVNFGDLEPPSNAPVAVAPVKSVGFVELKKIVGGLAPRTAQISELDNTISTATKRLEEGLRAHISTRVSTTLQASDDGMWIEQLTFGKFDGRWQLLIESGEIDDENDWKTTPLVSAPRETRLNAFNNGHVEKLIRNALAQLDAQIKERVAAVEIAGRLIAVLEPEPDPKGGSK